MLIKKLILKGYKRLLLNNIEYFEYNPSHTFQVIIGTNGSGKSSVMRELSPLPASPADYVKGGVKTIELEDKGKDYILTSDFTTGSKHSFYCVDTQEELNSGYTATVQKDLVRSVFGLTPELFDILTGSLTFTQMSATKRREWIVTLSASDLDYAIGIYNRIKSNHRDTQGAIKHLNNRITAETDKLIEDQVFEDMLRLSNGLASELNVMMEGKSASVESARLIQSEIHTQLHQLNELSKALLQIRIDRPQGFESHDWKALSDVSNTLTTLKADYQSTETRLNTHREELQHFQEIVDALAQSDTQGVDELEAKVATLEIELQAQQAKIRQYAIADQPDVVYAQSQSVLEPLQTLLASIPANDGLYTRTRQSETQERVKDNLLKRDYLQRQSDKLSHRFGHIQQASEVGCPKCGYIWKPGVNEGELSQIERESESIAQKMTMLSEQIKTDQEYLEAFEEYSHSLKRYRRLTESYPLLNPLWNTVLEQRIVFTTPLAAMGFYQQWLADVETSVSIAQLSRKLKEYHQAIDHAHALNRSEHTHFGQRLETLNREIESGTQMLVALRRDIESISKYGSRLSEFLKKSESVGTAINGLTDLQNQFVDSYRNDILTETIRDHQIQLSRVSDRLMTAKLAADLVNDIIKDRDRQEQQLKAYDALMRELSPVDGLIAEQINDFIAGLVGQINAVIAAIWTYDMEVQPCGLESGELDYKFPLVVRNHGLVVPDVSKASSSQIDVVDFAFKLIVMLYLDLQDYPIYLDELAPTLDEQHRINIMRYVKELVESQKCSQLFMISHYSSMHDSFGHAQTLMMDAANIINKPGQYNTHVIMR